MGQFTYTVPPEYDGAQTGAFLRRGCGLSWRTVVRCKNVADGITADGVWRRTIDPVYAGQRVRLLLPDDTVRIEGVDLPLDVVYEDGDVIVVN